MHVLWSQHMYHVVQGSCRGCGDLGGAKPPKSQIRKIHKKARKNISLAKKSFHGVASERRDTNIDKPTQRQTKKTVKQIDSETDPHTSSQWVEDHWVNPALVESCHRPM